MSVFIKGLSFPNVNGFKISQFTTEFAPHDLILSNTSIYEDSTAGTIVGTLQAFDNNDGETFTYVLLDNAGNRFRIVADQLQAGSVVTAFATSASHSITIRAIDRTGRTLDRVFLIEVKQRIVPSFISYAVSDSSSITTHIAMPANVQIGDTLVLFAQHNANGGGGPMKLTSGWTVLRDFTNQGVVQGFTAYRRVTQNDIINRPTTTIGRTSSSAYGIYGSIAAFRGRPDAELTVGGLSQGRVFANENYSCPSVTASQRPALVLNFFSHASAQTNSTPAGWVDHYSYGHKTYNGWDFRQILSTKATLLANDFNGQTRMMYYAGQYYSNHSYAISA